MLLLDFAQQDEFYTIKHGQMVSNSDRIVRIACNTACAIHRYGTAESQVRIFNPGSTLNVTMMVAAGINESSGIPIVDVTQNSTLVTQYTSILFLFEEYTEYSNFVGNASSTLATVDVFDEPTVEYDRIRIFGFMNAMAINDVSVYMHVSYNILGSLQDILWFGRHYSDSEYSGHSTLCSTLTTTTNFTYCSEFRFWLDDTVEFSFVTKEVDFVHALLVAIVLLWVPWTTFKMFVILKVRLSNYRIRTRQLERQYEADRDATNRGESIFQRRCANSKSKADADCNLAYQQRQQQQNPPSPAPQNSISTTTTSVTPEKSNNRITTNTVTTITSSTSPPLTLSPVSSAPTSSQPSPTSSPDALASITELTRDAFTSPKRIARSIPPIPPRLGRTKRSFTFSEGVNDISDMSEIDLDDGTVELEDTNVETDTDEDEDSTRSSVTSSASSGPAKRNQKRKSAWNGISNLFAYARKRKSDSKKKNDSKTSRTKNSKHTKLPDDKSKEDANDLVITVDPKKGPKPDHKKRRKSDDEDDDADKKR